MSVPVVFHFVSNNNGNNFMPGPLAANPWDTDQSYGSRHAFILMLGINNRLANIVRNDNDPNPSNEQGLKDAKNRFKFKYPNYSNDNFRFYSNASNVAYVSDAFNIVVSGTQQSSNGSYPSGGYADGVGSGIGITLKNFAKLQLDIHPMMSIHYIYETIILHEFGHLMSLNHTFHCSNRCSGRAFNFLPNDKEECCGHCKNHNGDGNPNCFGCSPMVMGYGSQYIFSLCELEGIWTNHFKRTTPFTDICNSPVNETAIVLSDNQSLVWDDQKIINSDLVLESGTNLTVKCKVMMGNGRKVIVKKGAALNIDGGIFTSFCSNQWQGIVVEGNGAAQSGAGKVTMSNNAVIEYAKIGISMNPTHIPWPALASSWGGLVEADNGIIRNCDRAVEFMQMNNDDSYFTGCSFTGLKNGVTLWDNEGVDFTNCNFSNIQNMAIQTYDSRITAYGNTITGVRDGVEIISSGASSGTSKYYSNTIDANRYAIDGTAQNGLKPLECFRNTLIGGNASFSMNGISNFEFIGNQVVGADFGARLHSTGGGQEADVHNNTFSSIGTASLVNHETNTEYLDNCFYYSGEDIQINSGTVLSEQGDEIRAANNCFTKNGVSSIKVMNNGGSSLFTYHLAHIEQPTCKTPTEYQDPSRGYDLEWGAPEVVVNCGDPVYIKYRKCPLPKNAAEYALMKKELEAEIKKLEANTTMNATLKAHLIKKYKACLSRIQREIIIIIKEEDPKGSVETMKAVEVAKSSEFFEIQILGFSMLMDQKMYDEARTYLQQMNTSENVDAIDFVSIQNINLGYYRNIGNYQLSIENRNTLRNIGVKTSPIAGYARGLYYKLTGEKMEVNYIHDNTEVVLRNRTNNIDSGFDIQMYPNPVDNNILNIELSHFDISSKMEAVIYDAHGNMVKNIDISGKGHISNDVSNLSSGVYIVSFIQNGHRIHTKRFVKI